MIVALLAATAAIVAWGCVLMANPGRPAGVSEEAALVFSRHAGARERLIVLALVLTMVALALLVWAACESAAYYGTVPACTENAATRGLC